MPDGRAYLDAGVQQVVRVGEHGAARPPGNNISEQVGEMAGHVGERGVDVAILVTALRGPTRAATDVVELLLQEPCR